MITGPTIQTSIQSNPNALNIPYVTADEAFRLLEREFEEALPRAEFSGDTDFLKDILKDLLILF